MRRALSWLLAVLAAVALMVSVVAAFATREVFDADQFAARTETALRSDAVSEEVARRLTDAVLSAEPDLVAVRPLVLGAAEGVVRSAAFGAVVRGSVRDLHRSAFDADAGTVTLTVADAGLLVSDALDQLRPDLGARIPDTVRVALTDTASGPPLELVQAAQNVRWLTWIALAVALLAAAAAVLVGGRAGVRGEPAGGAGGRRAAGEAGDGGGGRGAAGAGRGASLRAGALRVGAAVAAVAGLTGLAASLGPRVLTGDAALRVVLETWLDPLATRCWVVCVGALLVTTAAAAMWRPPTPGSLLKHARRIAERVPPVGRALAAIALGIVALVAPLTVLEVVVMGAGALAILWGVGELMRRVAPPAPAPRVAAPRRPRVSPRRVAVPAAVALLAAGALAFSLSPSSAAPLKVGRCNGTVALCDKPLDQVAFVGTHNSMSAAGEPGWLFPAQNAGIDQQLQDGVRALLIDTHYGFQTPRGVATDLEHDSKSREKITAELGEEFVATALRLRGRIGFTGDEPREVFLCHAFCEVGATNAVEALRGVHEFLVEHAEEVLILSIEDDTDPQDTARIIRESGLIREVYQGPATPPWPTLKEMIERNERVLVLIENRPGTEPWMHRQDAVTQETPFHFSAPAELEAPDSCEANRGGDKGSLLLVNHWVDTSPAPRRSIAKEVNAREVLGTRLKRCQQERGLLPNIVAVDFYRDGDVFPVVQELG